MLPGISSLLSIWLHGDLAEDEQHDDHLDQHQVRHEQALDRLMQHEQLVHEAGMRASFFIDGMPMKSLKALLSFILRVLCSGMGGRAGQGATEPTNMGNARRNV